MCNEKILYGTKIFSTNEQNFVLNYYVTKIEVNNKLLYGIAIEKIHNALVLEDETVYNISEKYDTVREIINKMIDYTVTPMSMVNILDDIVPEMEETSALLSTKAC